ncbi:unnamed protein product [Parnassius apollo]|uniref:(apollo) hypothetical protein n=1 Tax=Parnassius apollo TaxID=110799 RepID=A0A8S3W113_PARAO|nr:unnamed protein product [Parnassius apollo]
MESRGKRLVSMINKPKIRKDDLDEEPGPLHQRFCSPSSNCTSALSDSRERIVAEMERMFDSDDSDKDPTYNPDPSFLIQPEDLFGEQWANNKVENLENVMQFYGDDHDEEFQPNDGDVMIAQVLPTSDAQQVVISLWGLLLKGVFDATRKRKRWMKPEPENWKVNIAKKRRSEEERNNLRRHYWSLRYTEQKNFILGNVEVDTPKRILAIRGPKKQRQFTKRCFFFHNGEKKQVCQKFFCYTLAISPTVVNDAIRKRNDMGLYKDSDKRGKHEPPNKTNEADVNFVKKHIESFPVMEPHYIRQTSKRRYLDASLSITKMHQLYKDKCTENNMIPDQCLICSNFNKASDDEKLVLKEEYKDHLARKASCYSEKAKDKERAEKDKEFRCVTIDLQAVLQIPSGLEESSKIYFNYDMSETFLYIDVDVLYVDAKNTEPSQHLSTRAKKRKETTTPQTIVLKQLYLNPLPISEAKKRDLLSLCTKKIIPEEYHGWYSSLPTATNQADRLPEPSIDEESSED